MLRLTILLATAALWCASAHAQPIINNRQSVGTTAGTVAAGDDARIKGALQTSNASGGLVTPSGGTVASSLSDLSARIISLTDFGAKCDVVSVNATAFTASNPVITASGLTSADVGKRAALLGTGAGNATLFTTIDGVSGTSVTLHDAPSISGPKWYAHGLVTINNGGVGYAVGDTITFGSMVLTVKFAPAGVVTAAVITTQGVFNSLPSLPLSQDSTSGSGTGITVTPILTQIGKLYYGTNDDAAIAAATAAVTKGGLRLPRNKACGFTQPFSPSPGVWLIGEDSGSSGFVQLGGGLSHALYRGTTFAYGGGWRNLYLTALKGSDYPCEILGGYQFTVENVRCINAAPDPGIGGATSEWHNGDPASASTGENMYSHIVGFTDQTEFPLADQMPTSDWFNETHGQDSQVVHSSFYGGKIPLNDQNFGGMLYDDIDAFGLAPMNPATCVRVYGASYLDHLQLGNCTQNGVDIGASQIHVGINILQWAASIPDSNTYGVTLESGVSNVAVDGANPGFNSLLDGDHIIRQIGTAGSNNIVCMNPGANLHQGCVPLVFSTKTSSQQSIGGGTAGLQNIGSGSFGYLKNMFMSNSASPDLLYCGHSRSATVGSFVPLQADDQICQQGVVPDDGSSWNTVSGDQRWSVCSGATVSTSIVPTCWKLNLMDSAGTLWNELCVASDGSLWMRASSVSNGDCTTGHKIADSSGQLYNQGSYVSHVLGASGAAVSVPADTTEDTLATILIPAGSMGPNGCLSVETVWSFTGSTNAKTFRARLASTAGTAYLSNNTSTAGNTSASFVTTICGSNSQNAQVGAAPGGTPGFASAATLSSTADMTINQNLYITGQKASSGETLQLVRYRVLEQYAP